MISEGENAVRAGVAPQIAQRLMRRSDYRTTLRHYTILGLADTAGAVARMPGIAASGPEVKRATGTDDSSALLADCVGSNPQLYPQQLPRQLQRGRARTGAACHNESGDGGVSETSGIVGKTTRNTDERDSARVAAGMERKRFELSTSTLQRWHSTN